MVSLDQHYAMQSVACQGAPEALCSGFVRSPDSLSPSFAIPSMFSIYQAVFFDLMLANRHMHRHPVQEGPHLSVEHTMCGLSNRDLTREKIDMLAEERRARILERVSSAGLVRIADLVDELGVSVMTVRRDLDILAADGQLEKIHGGAALRSRPSNSENWAPVRRIADPQQTHVAIVVPRIDYY